MAGSTRFLRLGLSLGLLVLPAVAQGDIYTFTGPDGTIHFASSPTGDKRYRLYIKGNGWEGHAAAPGVVPVPPSDHDIARYTRYSDWIREAATLYQIPDPLVRAIIRCESDYDPRAVSVSGARGLMQLMPETATLMQVRDIEDPRENIFGGIPPFTQTRDYVVNVTRFYRRYRSVPDAIEASLGGSAAPRE